MHAELPLTPATDPMAQPLQATLPLPDVYVPTAQRLQMLELSCAVKEPGAHCAQEVIFPLLYLPTPHASRRKESADGKKPGGASMHRPRPAVGA